MLLALQLDDEILNKPPPFCSHFEFEFYENEEQNEYVQVYYNGELVTIGGAKSKLISKKDAVDNSDSFGRYPNFCVLELPPQKWHFLGIVEYSRMF